MDNESEIDYDSMPKDNFSMEEMLVLWSKYTEVVQKNGNNILHSAMVSSKPTIDGNTIVCEIYSSFVESQFEKESTKLLKYLRENLNNYSITLKTPIVETDKTTIIVSNKEKYNLMFKKNSLLKDFITTLNLEVI